MNKNTRKRNRNEHVLKIWVPAGSEPVPKKLSQIRIAKEIEKVTRNRCCYVRPKQNDFGQSTDASTADHADMICVPSGDQSSMLVDAQNGFNPEVSNIASQQLDTKKTLNQNAHKINNYSQYDNADPKLLADYDSANWQNIDSVQDIEEFIQETTTADHLKESLCSLSKYVHISEAPKVKIIAEKFSKFKRNNIELRRLDEKVVCLEYDVYNQDEINDGAKPVQRMRAFFSIKPSYEDNEESHKELPLEVKQEFKLSDDDLSSLTEQEIEIIDDNIEENESYLNDLKRILKQKQYIDNKRKKSSLDLKYLYEIAKRATHCLNGNDFFSKAELQEVKDLILGQCKSSVHGISRRKIKSKEGAHLNLGVLSGEIIAELLRDTGKIDGIK